METEREAEQCKKENNIREKRRQQKKARGIYVHFIGEGGFQNDPQKKRTQIVE